MITRGTGFTFARGGSKGVPRKNLRLLAGRPLVAHAVAVSQECELISKTIISTDDPEIRDVAVAHGAEAPFLRPKLLATDTAGEWSAWQHAIKTMQELGQPVELFVSIPPTAPLRRPEDVDRCIAALCEEPECDIVVTVTVTNHSPYFNMVEIDPAGLARRVIEPDVHISRRQDCPQVFNLTTVAYAAWPDYVLSASGLFDGRVKTIEVPVERAIDIDSELDLKMAEYLMGEGQILADGT
jgi:N,N'-diacetyl-8-epilegionaminate cytidylyltransferase